tara:strand:+ start:63 stop:197 length:135 start_codon:yes stop_codon:yes gene_type:complete
MGKPGPKAHSVINDLLKKAKGKSPLKQQKLPMNNSAVPAYKKYM